MESKSHNTNTKEYFLLTYKVTVPRTIFSYNLNIHEVRLCVFMTSNKNIDRYNLTFNEKMYIVGSDKHKLKNIQNYFDKLISLGLLDENGSGINLIDNHIESFYLNPNIFYEAKTLKEVFALCIKYWKGNKSMGFAYISDEELNNLFSRRYFKRNLDTLNNGLKRFDLKIEYEKTRNGNNKFTIKTISHLTIEEEYAQSDSLQTVKEEKRDNDNLEKYDNVIPKIKSNSKFKPMLNVSDFSLEDLENFNF